MSTLLATIKGNVLTSLKEGDTVMTGTLRFLLSAIRNHAIDLYGSRGEEAMTDDDVMDIIRKQVKSHKESVVAFNSAGRNELAHAEQAQLDILLSYLPPDIGADDIKRIIEEEHAAKPDAFGPLMGRVMKRTQGKADGSLVAALVKEFLSGKE